MWREENLKYKWLSALSLLLVISLVVLPIPSFSENKFYLICPDEVKNLLKTSIKVTGWVYTEKSSIPDGLILEIPREIHTEIHTLKVIDIQNIKGIFEPTVYFALLQSINLRDRYVLVFKRIGNGDLYVRISLLDEISLRFPYVCELQYWGLSGAPK